MKYRWGQPLSFAEAEALARRWLGGDIISEVERYHRFQKWIQEQVDKYEKGSTFSTLNEIRQDMESRGIEAQEMDIDPNLLAHSKCEETCAGQCQDLVGSDVDQCFWECMDQCSPVKDPMTQDFDDPLFPASEVPDDHEFTTTLSLPPRRDRKVTSFDA